MVVRSVATIAILPRSTIDSSLPLTGLDAHFEGGECAAGGGLAFESPQENHAFFAQDVRDESWAYTMELGINENLAANQKTNGAIIESVESRSRSTTGGNVNGEYRFVTFIPRDSDDTLVLQYASSVCD